MNVFADTTWLEALYFKGEDKESLARRAIVERRMRRQPEPLIISHIVLLEARNVFGGVSGEPQPQQWDDLTSDFNTRIFVDPMNWNILRQATNRIFEQFSHKTMIGSFDATLIGSAQLAGAQEVLSFDEGLKALAVAFGLKVFPALTADGRSRLAELQTR